MIEVSIMETVLRFQLNHRRSIGILAFVAMTGLAAGSYVPPSRGLQGRSITLSGEWAFELDPQKVGQAERWFARPLTDRIRLPGTLDEGGKGTLNTESCTGKLTRVRTYSGPAWFQRTIDLPSVWSGKRVLFVVERAKTTRVWIDERLVGAQNTLTSEQVFDLGSSLQPGPHRLTVCVDNADRPPVGDPHQLSDETQTNWNGLLGRIELQMRDEVWIENVRTFPDVGNKRVRVVIALGQEQQGQTEVTGTVRLSARLWNAASTGTVEVASVTLNMVPHAKSIEGLLPLGADAQPWSEFSPSLYRLRVELTADVKGTSVRDQQELDFGLREFTRKGTQFTINGRTTFLRGKHDACVFPLTGYAPMGVEEWSRVLRIAKDYGINHYRFHSWCPPEAAFAAADIVGIYMQPELPNWSSFGEPVKNITGDVELRNDGTPGVQRTAFLLAEGRRIFQAYANHPSFVMFALGNELGGSRPGMAALLAEYRTFDPRPLYAEGSNNFLGTPTLAPGDDYWTTVMTGGHYSSGLFYPDTRNHLVRGSFADHTTGHVNNRLPGTMHDYREALRGVPVPVIGHEIGQYQVFPNFREIAKYTGVLQARNFECFRERLERAGMLGQADRFVQASGALAVICYREDVEAALRTPGMGGFQLLDLQDFPGQGTALVGILDAFMESKGLITPQAWREFCGPTVPLLRMERYAWLQDEDFHATAELAHYGPTALHGVRMQWSVTDAKGVVCQEGTLQPTDVPQGSLTALGALKFELARFAAPAQYTLTLERADGSARNRYRFWVYPSEVQTHPPTGVVVTRALNATARRVLSSGGRVVVLPTASGLVRSVPGAFQADFWCYPMFKKYNPPGTLGILCDPAHPALAAFPTQFHSDWQWWPIVRRGRAMILDDTPATFQPFVQVIDNFYRNHKLALAFEAKVGNGRLLVCSGALVQQPDQAEARQLLSSLLSYAGSERFSPTQSLEWGTLEKILKSEESP
jgi:hypothetical protein